MFNSLQSIALAVALGASAGSATAELQPIFKAPLSAQDATKSKAFGVNAELGRAWVEVRVYQDRTETDEIYRVIVPGLSFKKDSGQVVYEADGKTVVCATLRQSGGLFFKTQRVEPTGNCELTRRYVKQAIDNGFAVDVVEHFEVYLQPNDHSVQSSRDIEQRS